MQYITVSQIETPLATAINNIKLNFRSINGRNGWHQYLGSEKIGNIATAQALLLLQFCNEDFDSKHLAFEYLKNAQYKDTENNLMEGGWSYVTNFSELPTTECTCWVLLALHEKFSNSIEAQNGIKWLLMNHPNSNNESGWGTLKYDNPRIYSTCLALRTLHKYGYINSPEFQKSLNWLVRSQNTDSGWGEQFGHKSTIFHTSFVINTLLEIYDSKNSIIQNAISWLKINFNSPDENPSLNGSQEIIDFDYQINGNIKHQRLIYFHTPLPHAVIALIKTGNIYNDKVFLALKKIVRDNNNGYWKHPNFDDSIQKPLWLVYDMALALKTFKSHFANWEEIIRVELNNNKLTIISSTNPFAWKIFFKKFILGFWGKLFAVILISLIVTFVLEMFPTLTTENYIALILIPLIVELLGYYITEVNKKNNL